MRMRLFIGSHVRLGRIPKHILKAALVKGGAKKNLRRFIKAVDG